MELFRKIITHVLTALYQPFWFSVIMSIMFMFVWSDYSSIRSAAQKWIAKYKDSKEFRRMFGLTFYSVMILFRTLMNRAIWAKPLSNVISVWGLYTIKNGERVLTTEVLENLALFIPFTILLLWTYRDKLIGDRVSLGRVLWHSTKIVFMFSLTIEMLQLFLHLGTWQLRDIFFNTLGGFIGGLLYWIGYRIKHRKLPVYFK